MTRPPFLLTFLALLVLILHTPASHAALCRRADTPAKARLVSDAKAVLDGNWVPGMNSTLPSPNLYPHQWSWDAAFVAIGYSHYDTRRAIDEMSALLRGQWANGHIPHIVFNPSAVESYFPGPSFWKVDTAGSRGPADGVFTSGITQPAVHAAASLAIYRNAPDAESKLLAREHLMDFMPRLSKWHDYLYRERDPYNRDLVFIRHMWESGMDNSPMYDPTLQRMKLKPEDIPPYQRVDKGKVGNVKERPDNFFYDRAVSLIKLFYDNEYDEARIVAATPFLIEDVLFNSILARAGVALSEIASVLGDHAEATRHLERAKRTSDAINDKLYDAETGFYYSYDLVTKQQIKTRISGGLLAVYGASMDTDKMDSMVKHLLHPGFLGEDLTSWTIPSVAMDDPAYTNTTYWKGPAWININYLVRDGLLRNAGGNEDARRIGKFLREKSLDLMSKSGFYEYFNPKSGSPHGGHQFSWSAALTIDMVCSDNSAETPVQMFPMLKAGAALLAVVVLVAGLAVSVKKTASVEETQAVATTTTTEDDDVATDAMTATEGKKVAADVVPRGAVTGSLRHRHRGPVVDRRRV